jgi:hypothetical protein
MFLHITHLNIKVTLTLHTLDCSLVTPVLYLEILSRTKQCRLQ